MCTSSNLYLKQVLYKAIISDLEYRSFWIFVNGNNNFTIFHTSKMLDSSRDTNSYIQVLKYRNDDLAIIDINLERNGHNCASRFNVTHIFLF